MITKAEPHDLDAVVRRLPQHAKAATARVLDDIADEDRTALGTRLLNAVADVLDALKGSPVDEIIAASSDRESLIRALEATPLLAPSPREAEAQLLLQQARLRGVQTQDRLLQAEGGVVSAARAAELLHATRQTVNNRRLKGTLIGFKVGRRGYLYPLWQFDGSGTLHGLEEALTKLDGRDSWTQAAFMLNANTRLGGRRPLDLLRDGDVEPVLEAASAYGHQGGA